MSDSLEDELQQEIDRLSRHCDSYAAENAKLQDENRKMNQTLASDAIEIFKLRAALEELRAWCADKGDLDGELMAEAALTNEQKP